MKGGDGDTRWIFLVQLNHSDIVSSPNGHCQDLLDAMTKGSLMGGTITMLFLLMPDPIYHHHHDTDDNTNDREIHFEWEQCIVADRCIRA